MIRRIVLIGLLAVVSLGVTAAPVGANSGDVITRGHSSGASVWKLKLSREDGRLETEFEVDQNINNRLWNVSMYQNGAKTPLPREPRPTRRSVSPRCRRGSHRDRTGPPRGAAAGRVLGSCPQRSRDRVSSADRPEGFWMLAACSFGGFGAGIGPGHLPGGYRRRPFRRPVNMG